MKCPRCGAINDNNEQFCYNCGLRLEAPAPSSAGAPTILIPPPDQQGPPQQPQAGGAYPTGYGPPVPTPPSYNPSPYGTPPTYGQQPYGAPYGTQPLYPAIPSTSTAAVVSLVFGILGWLFLFGIGGVVAIITGHIARGNIRRSNGTVAGGGMALAGLILGYLNLLAAVLLCALFVIAVIVSRAHGS